MNACSNWHDRLLDYALGALEATAAHEVEQHVAGCAACAATLTDLHARRGRLDAALHALVQGAEPSPSFRAQVLRAAETETAPSFAWRAWMGAAPAVVLILLAVVVAPWMSERNEFPSQEVAAATALTQWRAPSDALLRSPAEELLRAPQLGEFYFPLEPEPSETSDQRGGNHEG
ncbi:MAG: anti-sigma factor family protein [Terriglobia bacterium]